jgi:hypothetical protein
MSLNPSLGQNEWLRYHNWSGYKHDDHECTELSVAAQIASKTEVLRQLLVDRKTRWWEGPDNGFAR